MSLFSAIATVTIPRCGHAKGGLQPELTLFFVFVLQIPNHGGSSVGYETRSEPETRAAQRQLRLYESPDGVARIHGTCVGVTNNDD